MTTFTISARVGDHRLLGALAPALLTLPPALILAALVVRFDPIVPLVLAAALGGACVVVTRPLAGALLATLLIPFELFSLPLGGAGLTAAEALFALSGLSWAVRRLLAARRPAVPSALTAPIVLLLLAIVPGVFVAIDVFAVVKTLVMWSLFACVFWLIVADGRVQTVERLLLALGVAGAIVGLVALATGGPQRLVAGGDVATGRAVGSFASPNTLASFLALALPGALALAVRGRALVRPVAIASAAAIGLGLALSLSRGGLLAAIGAVGLMLLWAPLRRVAAVAAAVLAILTLNGTATIVSNQEVSRVAQRLATVSSSAKSADPRLELWPALPHVIADHPVFGIGMNQFALVAPQYGLRDPLLDAPFQHAHDVLLNFWVELGIPGLVAVLWLAFVLVRLCLRACRRQSERERGLGFAVSAALLAFALHGLVDVTLRANVIAAILFVLAACATVLAREAPAQASATSR